MKNLTYYFMAREKDKAGRKIGFKLSEETKRKIGLSNRGVWIKFNCDSCNKENEKKQSRFNKSKRHFCNIKCYSFFRETKLPLEEQPAYKGGERVNKNRTYKTWQAMKNRCLNKSSKNDLKYRNYGERNISVCERWIDSFQNFLEDMGERPQKRSLDRIDNDKGYSKENCRWATSKQQANNKRTNIRFKGKSISEWASYLQIDYPIIYRNYRNGELENFINNLL